jgi:coenzyme F420-0:L-glutamate ligase
MKVKALRTPLFSRGDPLETYLETALKKQRRLPKDFVLAITSKIVSLAEGRTVPTKNITKEKLVRQQAGKYLGKTLHNVHLTVTHGLLIPSAGIDSSNSENGDYILLPQDPFRTADSICRFLRRRFRGHQIGVILTDSRSQPLRWGVTGVSLAHAGIVPCQNRIGEKDLFARPLEATRVNVVDSLAAAAVLCMGEAAERSPLALISEVPVEFTRKHAQAQNICITPAKDLFFHKLFKK